MTSSDKLQGGRKAPLAPAQVGTPTGCRVPGCTMTKGAHERTYLELEQTHGPRTADDFAWRHRWGDDA